MFHKNSNKKESRTSTDAFSWRRKKSTEVGTIHTRAEEHSVQRQVATNKCRRPRQPHGRAHPDRFCSRKEVTNVRLATAHSSAQQDCTESPERDNTHSVLPQLGTRSTARPHALLGRPRLPSRTPVHDTSPYAPAVGSRPKRVPSLASGPTRPVVANTSPHFPRRSPRPAALPYLWYVRACCTSTAGDALCHGRRDDGGCGSGPWWWGSRTSVVVAHWGGAAVHRDDSFAQRDSCPVGGRFSADRRPWIL